MGAEVITVSTDTQFVHLAWQNSEKELRDVKYPMGADPTGKLSRQFNIDELMRRFKANMYLARKATEACPSKWKDEGDKTLEPNAKMVGKVWEALNE
jgi:peroxiredoxin (alkyl hydroperoxide reductase subunit C)